MKNPFIAKDLPIEYLSTDAVASDITTLVSASSFLGHYSTNIDPRAGDLFESVVTDYCSGSKLIVPLPQKSSGAGDFFVDLWTKDATATELHGLELTDLGFQVISKKHINRLIDFIEGDPQSIAEWLALQFSMENADRHLSRSDTHAILRAGPLAREPLDKGRLERFKDALVINRIKEPAFYTEYIGKDEIPRLTDLCFAYVVSVAVRRLAYAGGIDQSGHKPIYRPHWIGNPVMKDPLLPETIRTMEAKPVTRFPWGMLLRRYINLDPAIPISKLRESLLGLRQNAGQFQNEYLQQPLVKNASDSALTEREAIVVETLMKVGLVPRFAESTRRERLAKVLRSLTEHQSAWKFTAELITTSFQAEWARNLEAGFRIRFRRDNFWDVFEDSGVKSLRNKKTDWTEPK
jgi:hypothetical protein